MERTADVAIVGAGVIGLSLGWALAREGLHVIALDSSQPGGGASSAAAGMLAIVPEGAVSEALIGLCRRSLDGYREWCEGLREATGIDVEYRDEGSLLPATSDADLPLLAGAAAAYTEAGLEVETISPEEARRREPLLTAECRGALVVAGDCQVHTHRLVDALRVAAPRAGVCVESATRVLGVLARGDRVTGIQTTHGDVAAPWVVIAAGAWSGALGGRAGVPQIPIRPVKGEIVCLATGSFQLGRIVQGPECYLVPRRDGRLLVGATEVDGSFDGTVSAGAVRNLLTAATRLVPALGECPVVGLQAGLRPTTPDRLPILGPLGAEGLLVATGHYRKGILLAPETARLLAECICAARVPQRLALFSPARFSADR